MFPCSFTRRMRVTWERRGFRLCYVVAMMASCQATIFIGQMWVSSNAYRHTNFHTRRYMLKCGCPAMHTDTLTSSLEMSVCTQMWVSNNAYRHTNFLTRVAVCTQMWVSNNAYRHTNFLTRVAVCTQMWVSNNAYRHTNFLTRVAVCTQMWVSNNAYRHTNFHTRWYMLKCGCSAMHTDTLTSTLDGIYSNVGVQQCIQTHYLPH